MHYKNGREAKNGDKVVLISAYSQPTIGILYDAVAANDPWPNLAECLHIDDAKAVLLGAVPDTSKPAALPEIA